MLDDISSEYFFETCNGGIVRSVLTVRIFPKWMSELGAGWRFCWAFVPWLELLQPIKAQQQLRIEEFLKKPIKALKDDRRQQRLPKSAKKLTTGHRPTKVPFRSQRCEGMKQNYCVIVK